MKTICTLLCIVFLFDFSGGVLAGADSGEPLHPAVEGVMGVLPAMEGSCAAIWLAIPGGRALSGIEWFNNDGSVAFPGLYFESGTPDFPLALEETVLAAENVTGESAAWSSVTFNEPVTCASEGLYIIFRFPEGIEATAFGMGGGPAIGYLNDFQGAPGWICSDGESWDKVGGEFGFAVIPVLVDSAPGMLQLMGEGGGDGQVEAVEPLVTMLQTPYPNPFNPSTILHYSLAEPGDVDLAIYDIRGHLVVRMAKGHHPAGSYEATWTGTDQGGRRVASGVYFARFEAGDVVNNHRLVLIK